MKKAFGFTLLEVMIALLVVAIALSAVIKSNAEGTRQLTMLRDKTFAHWAAMNLINELRLETAFPDLGSQSGETRLAEQVFYWQRTTEKTPDTKLRRVDLQLFADAERKAPLTRLVIFLADFRNAP
jgi:general secretion pathway protein I